MGLARLSDGEAGQVINLERQTEHGRGYQG